MSWLGTLVQRHLEPEPASEVEPGACDERVAEVGFADGHEWKVIGYAARAGASTPLYCTRCGENGWEIKHDRD